MSETHDPLVSKGPGILFWLCPGQYTQFVFLAQASSTPQLLLSLVVGPWWDNPKILVSFLNLDSFLQPIGSSGLS